MNQDLISKLKKAEATLVDVVEKTRGERGLDGLKHSQWEALNQVRGVLMALEGPEVERQPFTETAQDSYCKDEVTQRHESFGAISLTKPTGRMRLFGSVLDTVPSFICLRINRARRIVDNRLLTEHVFPDQELIEVFLSATQWAELVSSFNGTSIPCTIRAINRVGMDPVPEEVKTPLETISAAAKKESRKYQADGEAEFKAALKALADKVDSLGLSKKKAEELKKEVSSLVGFIAAPVSAASWAATRITEDTEKAVSAAKVEMAGALESMMQRVGLHAIDKQGGLLSALRSMVSPQLPEETKK